MNLKTDRFVVETDTHFPTDYNLLWDSGRPCIDMAEPLGLAGWRKSGHWPRRLKELMRTVGRISRKGGPNKAKRLRKAALPDDLEDLPEQSEWQQLYYYYQMLRKHIDLMARRLIDGEKIPHEEKIFSIFQPWAECIKKGKTHPSVEIGKNLAITSDPFHLIVDGQLAEGKTDNQLTIPIARRVADKYLLQSLSVAKGFSDMADKKTLEEFILEVIMPKKGRRNESEKALEEAPVFRRRKNKHHAVESTINELEHRGFGVRTARDRESTAMWGWLSLPTTCIRSGGSCCGKNRQNLGPQKRPNLPGSTNLSTYPQISGRVVPVDRKMGPFRSFVGIFFESTPRQ